MILRLIMWFALGRMLGEWWNNRQNRAPRRSRNQYPVVVDNGLPGRAAKPAKVTRVPSPWGGTEVHHDY